MKLSVGYTVIDDNGNECAVKSFAMIGFDQHWNYLHDDSAPIMWAEATNYYRGKLVAKTKGGSIYTKPEIVIIDNSPEPEGELLRLVNIKAMCEKIDVFLKLLFKRLFRKSIILSYNIERR